MAPLQPDERPAVRREPGRGVEVRAGGDDLDVAGREIDRHEVVDPLAVGGHHIGLVALADRKEPTAFGIVGHVRVAPRAFRRDRLKVARPVDPVEAPGREVGDDDELARHERRGTPVFVDPGSGVEALRRQPEHRPVAIAPHEHLAALLVGPALEPPAHAARAPDLTDEDDALGQALDREGRRPAAVGGDGGSSHPDEASCLPTCRAATRRRTPPARASSRRG